MESTSFSMRREPDFLRRQDGTTQAVRERDRVTARGIAGGMQSPMPLNEEGFARGFARTRPRGIDSVHGRTAPLGLGRRLGR